MPATTNTNRRQEVRRALRRDAQRWWELLNLRRLLAAGVWTVVLAVGATLIALYAQRRLPWRAGEWTAQAIVSRTHFTAVDPQQTAADRQNAAAREPAVYVPDADALARLHGQLMEMGRLGADTQSPGWNTVTPALRDEFALTDESVFMALHRAASPVATPPWAARVDQFLDGLESLAILSPDDLAAQRAQDDRAFRIKIEHPAKGELEIFDHQLLSSGGTEAEQSALRVRLREVAAAFGEPQVEQAVVAQVLAIGKPLYHLDGQLTQERRSAAQERTPPRVINVKAGDVLVQRGSELTSQTLELLDLERQAYQTSLGWRGWALGILAMSTLMLGLSAAMWVALALNWPRIADNPIRGGTVTALLLVMLGATVAGHALGPSLAVLEVVWPVLLASMLVAIAYDPRCGLVLGAGLGGMVAATLSLSPPLVVVLLIGAAGSAGQLRDVRTRSKLLWVGLWTGLAMFAAAWILQLANQPLDLPHSLHAVWQQSVQVLVAGVATGLIVQGILPAVEKGFQVTTALSLKELTDASHPLLRRLAEDAPGTYQHSLRLADLAQSAADAISADSLLCKVGAMYHDVGKINKPLYFIENQTDGLNRHDGLSPAMSLLIIVGHVKDGVELAREAKLPVAIRHFIESHHGTTLVEYFFHAARQQSDQRHVAQPQEIEYRYPGPRPRTREAAILMLCDTVEGAARTLDEPTPARIEHLVRTLSAKRLNDGQFNDCPLTIQELRLVEESIIRTLTAMHHGRVRYPAASPAESSRGGNPPRASTAS